MQADLDIHRAADEMNTDLEVITLRDTRQTALEACTPSPRFSRADVNTVDIVSGTWEASLM